MNDKRFIYDGLYIRDLHGKIPPILTDNDKLIDKYLKELNGLHDENKELRFDNDIKFWKHQFIDQHNTSQLILRELGLAIDKGYEVSDEFKKWLDDLSERNKEVIAKHQRLFE